MKCSGLCLLLMFLLVSGTVLQEVSAKKGRDKDRHRARGRERGRDQGRQAKGPSSSSHRHIVRVSSRGRDKSIGDIFGPFFADLDYSISVNRGNGWIQIVGNDHTHPDIATTTPLPWREEGQSREVDMPHSEEWVRLRGLKGFMNAGIVEVYWGGRWGLVCDDNWDMQDANVVCRQLGFTQGALASPGQAHYGVDTGRWSDSDILMDEVSCDGDESRVQSCSFEERHDCSVSEAASVVCKPNAGCDEGWVSGGDTCYRFFGGASNIKTAGTKCKMLNSSLVSIESAQENNFLSNVLHLSDEHRDTAWFTSGRLSKKQWRWTKTVARSPKRPKGRGKKSKKAKKDRKKKRKGKKGKGRKGKGKKNRKSRKRSKRSAPRRMRRVRAAVESTKWFPGWGDSFEQAEPSDKRGHTCLVLTNQFPLPDGSPVSVDYFYWKASRCRNKSGTISFICEAPAKPSPVECYTGNGVDYRGMVSNTKLGTACLNWQLMGMNDTTHPGKGLGDHNYCRNPDNDQAPWCYVAPGKFGFCPVLECSHTTTPSPRTTTTTLPPETPHCPADQYYCGLDNRCVPQAFRCDGEEDCNSGEDEEDCEYPSEQFEEYADKLPSQPLKNVTYLNTAFETCAQKCLDSSNFPCRSFVYNDGQRLCQFMDDNDNTPVHLLPADGYTYYILTSEAALCTGKFLCNNSRCVEAEKMCNGVDDCGDRSDEISCVSPPAPMTVRLVGGEDNSGTVEVDYLGVSGIICDDSWDIRDARVVCKMLGYPGAERATTIAAFGHGNGNVVLDDMACTGQELTLQDCPSSPWRQHNCQPFEAAGVVCMVNKSCEASQFTCKSRGKDGEVCVPLSNICDGQSHCPDGSDETDCDLKIELKNGTSPSEGRVELIRNGVRGTVCDDDWEDVDAAVVCKTLGYRYGGEAVTAMDAGFGAGSGVIWMDQVGCSGRESSLALCGQEGWSTHDCTHMEDAGVRCHTAPTTTTTTTPPTSHPSVSVYLVGGSSPAEGRVELVIAGKRGTICDDSFDDRDAAVICRMAGFRGGKAVDSSVYGPGLVYLDIMVDELACSGRELTLLTCDRRPLGENDCTHSEDAGVQCQLPGGGRTTPSFFSTPYSARPTSPPVSVLEDSLCGLRPLERSLRSRRQANMSAPRAIGPLRLQKIVGGNMAQHGMYPWQAGIQKIYNVYDNGKILVGHWCGGTILNKHWILSAAHCFKDLTKSRLMIKVGDHGHKVKDTGEQQFFVEELIKHRSYSRYTHDSDIALLKVKSSDGEGIKFNDYVQPACLPASEADYVEGTECVISGWGETNADTEPKNIMRFARVPLLGRQRCRSLYKGDLTENMLCAGYLEGGIDTCQGDSGGPLVCKVNGVFSVLGITSWGNGCAQPYAPGIYSKVVKFLSWIENTIRFHSP